VICKYNYQINLGLLGIALNGKENPALFSYLCSVPGFSSSLSSSLEHTLCSGTA